MASAFTSSQTKPTVRAKPRGANVRAFIESVEKGQGPQPDFFTSSKSDTRDTSKSLTKTKSKATSISHRANKKPPILGKKPSVNYRCSSAKNVCSDDSQSVVLGENVRTGNSVSSERVVTRSDGVPIVEEEAKCPSEDSGNGDLKYSGSVSSGHSGCSSGGNDSHYQTVSELGSKTSDEGYSEISANQTSGIPVYSEPHSRLESITSEQGGGRAELSSPTKPSRSKHYAYHIPHKHAGGGTLTRRRDKVPVSGKAVARGRNTLKKKPSVDRITTDLQEGTAELNSLDQSADCLTPDKQASHDSTDSKCNSISSNSDFEDSEWETDSDHNPDSENNISVACASSHDTSATNIRSQSIFYTHQSSYSEATNSTNVKQLTLSRQRSSKKAEKQTLRFKRSLATFSGSIRRLKNLKVNIQDLKQSSDSKLSAMRNLFSKFKSASRPKLNAADISHPNLDCDLQQSSQHAPVATQLSTGSAGHGSCESSSDTNLQSTSSTSSVNKTPEFQSRRKIISSSPSNDRSQTKSTGVLLDAPPLPPRATKSCHSHYFDLSDTFTAPPPPPRTTSLSPNSACSEGTNRSSTPQPPSIAEEPADESLSSKLTKASPNIVPPSSPKPIHTCQSEASMSTSAMSSSPNSSSSSRPFSRNNSTPVMSSDVTPKLPARREGSKSLLRSSSPNDESILRRNEILNSAANHSRLSNDSSTETDAPDGRDSICDDLIEEEPLYQQYHASTLKRTVYPKPTKLADDSSTLLRSGGQPSISLWSSMPQVVNSRILEHMNSEEIKLQEAMFEVITSEASYLRSLNLLIEVFVNSVEFSDETIISPMDRKALFSNIIAVRNTSSKLFSELEAHWKDNMILTDICDIVSNFALRKFDVYVTYCSNQAFQDKTIKHLSSQSKEFREALAKLERSPRCLGLNMASFLLLPMQRITRLPLLLDAILRRQEIWSDQGNKAQACYEQLKRVVKKCNEGARKMEQSEQVIKVENQLLFTKIKKIPLASGNRQLIKSGEILHLNSDASKSAANIISVKPKPLYLFLFNDMLVITKKKGEAYSVLDYAARVNVDTEIFNGPASDPRFAQVASKMTAKFLFMLALLENHQKRHSEYLLACKTETERTRWTEAFTSQVNDQSSEDRIYESWDCPQVQVMHSYEAQGPDELTLDVGEIINILRKTADGWYEGEKVSDGETGWLPSSYTEELQTRHTKAKHLKQRYKLLQAAAAMNKTTTTPIK